MAEKIIRAYWDCPQCGTKGIDGLKDVCPGCGSGKDKNVRYYMKDVEEVSSEELQEAGISEEESDGLHKEWVCAYCGFLNNYADQTCKRCGADREEKEQDYGGDTTTAQYVQGKDGKLQQVNKPAADAEKPAPAYELRPEPQAQNTGASSVKRSGSGLSKFAVVAAILLALFLFWPHTSSEAITGFFWERSVTVEELQTFHESGWSLPYGARQTDSKVEFAGYTQVLDHYETVYQTRYRQVFDHYDVSYSYTDNGNGTFTQHEERTPVYRTESYEEAVQQPVYRNEPVYQRKYYYDVDRWVTLQTYTTSGNDHEPYWSDAYQLTNRERDDIRTESYYTIYNDTDRHQENYDTWSKRQIGDGVYVTKNTLGIEYSRKEKG